MSLRARLLIVSGLLVMATVTAVAWIISATARRSFERLDAQRTLALIGQFHREFELRGQELQQRGQAIADSNEVRRVALDASRPNADLSGYVNLTSELATAQQLEILELLTDNGSIISSAHWPARFGYREAWISGGVDWTKQPPFLAQIDAPEGQLLALMSVRPVQLGDKALYVVVGHKIDAAFLATLVPPEGSQLLLWRVGGADIADSQGHAFPAEPLAGLLSRAQSTRAETTQKLDLRADGLSANETAHAIPLLSRTGEPLAVLIVSSTRAELLQLQQHIRWIAVLTGLGALAVAVPLSLWWAARISRPVEELAEAAADVARGNWERSVAVSDDLSDKDEIVHLSRSFNQMTAELLSQRDRALQAERVAAWRELARRLAHELKNPLFPLQITVENLVRARESRSAEFDEVFRESTATLLAELSNLKKIIGRFSDFSKMPAPHLQRINVNELLTEIAKLYSAQLTAPGRAPIDLKLELKADHAAINGDPDLLRRAFENLILNAIDAMPDGGKLRVRTIDDPAHLVIEFSDTGSGLTPEECSRLFTPYYTTKQFGTGLGLAIVQSVISDHGADISVESEKQRGTTFRIRFPRTIDAGAALPHAEITTPSETPLPAKAHLLIIDDEANTLASLSRAFRLAGHEATVCDSAARAMVLLRDGSFDLILSDVVMPGKDGLALLEEIRAAGINTPVVMMSGQAHIEMAVRATKLGALDFLEKPISTEKLLLTLENALKLSRLEHENRELRSAIGAGEIVFAGETMQRLMDQVERVAASETRMAILGETGTGKELIARTLHEKSRRASSPFVTLNCAAVPAELIESELFGHEKGSFTGAGARHLGKFEQAQHGTLFLDEIGDMPLAMQAKLLRVLEQGEVERVGGSGAVKVDVRVIVATHRDLQEQVKQGKFRQDLFHRIYVFPLTLPALRERKEDIPALVEHFQRRITAQNKWKPTTFTPEGIQALQRYAWPGNIRELRNLVERLMLLASNNIVDGQLAASVLTGGASVSTSGANGLPDSGPLADRVLAVEREMVKAELERQHFHITNTAKALGLERSHLYKKCQQLGIDLAEVRKHAGDPA